MFSHVDYMYTHVRVRVYTIRASWLTACANTDDDYITVSYVIAKQLVHLHAHLRNCITLDVKQRT